METFYGNGTIPGVSKAWRVELDIDWAKKEIQVHLPQAKGAITQWPGLLVETFGTDEAVFRTKGIPPLGTHWWHIARYSMSDAWALVLGLPSKDGLWPSCSFGLRKL